MPRAVIVELVANLEASSKYGGMLNLSGSECLRDEWQISSKAPMIAMQMLFGRDPI